MLFDWPKDLPHLLRATLESHYGFSSYRMYRNHRETCEALPAFVLMELRSFETRKTNMEADLGQSSPYHAFSSSRAREIRLYVSIEFMSRHLRYPTKQ